MHDVIAIYAMPDDPAAFDAHFTSSHVPKVLAMPSLVEFVWGKVDGPGAGDPYLIARMTFADAEVATASLSSEAGQAAVADLDAFAQAGVVVHQVPRAQTEATQA